MYRAHTVGDVFTWEWKSLKLGVHVKTTKHANRISSNTCTFHTHVFIVTTVRGLAESIPTRGEVSLVTDTHQIIQQYWATSGAIKSLLANLYVVSVKNQNNNWYMCLSESLTLFLVLEYMYMHWHHFSIVAVTILLNLRSIATLAFPNSSLVNLYQRDFLRCSKSVSEGWRGQRQHVCEIQQKHFWSPVSLKS